MAIVDSPADFLIGRIVSRTFSVLLNNAAVFLGAAAILTLPVLVLSFVVGGNPLGGVGGGGIRGGILYAVSVIFSIVGGVLLQAVLIQGAVTYLNGEKPNLGKCLATAFQLFWPIIAITILFGLGLAGGFVLLVVPGIMLLTAWAVVIPVRVTENTGVTESFGRSRALTKGHRWKIFALLLMSFLIALLLELLISRLAGVSIARAQAVALSPVAILANWAVRAVAAALNAVGVAVIYYELRTVKEGAAPQELAAAFD